MNGRLDTMQAAVLLSKLTVFPEELRARERIAQVYAAGWAMVTVPARWRTAPRPGRSMHIC